jgi:pimeloyl-ACP methyl ester carboxylesterase
VLATSTRESIVEVNGVPLLVRSRGTGAPLVILHDDEGACMDAAYIEPLSRQFTVIMPSHPGFERFDMPAELDTVDDLAYLYLDLFEQLELERVVLVGMSFGGWIAAEMAVKSTARIARLVLVDALGIKPGPPEHRDIADMFALSQHEVDRRKFFSGPRTDEYWNALSDAEWENVARAQQTMALFGWLPYMHDPKLSQRLHRIAVPSLLLWGEHDGIVTPQYGEEYCRRIPGARLEVVAEAGHYPHREQPSAFAEALLRFTAV